MQFIAFLILIYFIPIDIYQIDMDLLTFDLKNSGWVVVNQDISMIFPAALLSVIRILI